MIDIINQSNTSHRSGLSCSSTPTPGYRSWSFRGRRENKPCLFPFYQLPSFLHLFTTLIFEWLFSRPFTFFRKKLASNCFACLASQPFKLASNCFVVSSSIPRGDIEGFRQSGSLLYRDILNCAEDRVPSPNYWRRLELALSVA
jgi:hypothetical protein